MSNFPLLSVLGIEIEYMLVHRDTLAIAPHSDEILKHLAGKVVNEYALGDIAVSNELVLHVLELKNNGPKPPTAPIAAQFQQALTQLQSLLYEMNLQFLPTGAHPFMNPTQETKRWHYDNEEIYQQFDNIFNCQGHGWSNLQSMHVNLPFVNDDDFKRLHNATRLLLPLLPALCASTPFLEGKFTGMACTRLHFYDTNQQKIPAISGDVIPPFIQSEEEYQDRILSPMYQAIKPFDPQGLLQHEWLNSRAAIPKFNYHALEIRIIDTQECVQADIAIAKAVWAILSHIIAESDDYLTHPIETRALKSLYDKAKKNALNTLVDDNLFMRQWGLKTTSSSARGVWSRLIERVSHNLDEPSQKALETMLTYGSLSERLVHACGISPTREELTSVYREVGECLNDNRLFIPDSLHKNHK